MAMRDPGGRVGDPERQGIVAVVHCTASSGGAAADVERQATIDTTTRAGVKRMTRVYRRLFCARTDADSPDEPFGHG